jgi:hypothetical protein
MRLSKVDPVLPGRPKGPIVISRDERDALFNRIALRLNGIDAVQIATEGEDWEKAAALGQEFSDLLALVCIDLGWGPGAGAEFTLRTPPEVLSRAVQAVEREAHADHEMYEQDLLKAKQAVAGAKVLLNACERIRTALSQAR